MGRAQMKVFLINDNKKETHWINAALDMSSKVASVSCYTKAIDLDIGETSFYSAFIIVNQEQFKNNWKIILWEWTNTLEVSTEEVMKALTHWELKHLSSEWLNNKLLSLAWVKGSEIDFYTLRSPLSWNLKKADKLPETFGEFWDEISEPFDSISNSIKSWPLILRKITY